MSKCNIQFELKNVIGSFIKVVEPEADMNSDKKKYSIQAIIPKDHPQLEEFKGAIMKIAKEAFPDFVLPADCRLLRDSDAEGKSAQYEYLKNTYFCNLRRNENQGPPPCALPDGSLFTPNNQILFSGCRVNIHIGLYDYTVTKPGSNVVMRRGVTGSLNGLQLVDNVNVERLGGGAPAPAFGVVEGATVNAVLGEGHAAMQPDEQVEKLHGVAAQEDDIPW